MCVKGRGEGAEGEREAQADSPLCVEPDDVGLDLMTRRSRPKPKLRVGRSADCTTQVPLQAAVIFHLTCMTAS